MIPHDSDPRRALRDADLDSQPVVGRTVRPTHPLVIAGVFALLAVALFLVLNARRMEQSASLVTPRAGASNAPLPAPPPLNIPAPQPPPGPEPAPVAVDAPPLPAPPPELQPDVGPDERLHAPAVVVDIPPGGAILAAAEAPAGTVVAQAQPSAAAATPSNEQFASQVSEASPQQAVATQLTGLGTTVAQGTMIPGVMETALNSDLPGFTRAIVSRDVRSFDVRAVLIPRGSRLIGQYRSAMSLGQSRVFVIWTRVIRPDGVSIQIGSPGEDALGRGGLTGDVDTHFFRRFGSSFLLSVLNGAVTAIAGTPTTQISIGSPAAAASLAASASIPQQGDSIMPTITVAQGAAINIFVARDLDFSPVKPVK